ncbi:putative Ig domain-containing protein [Kaarinaea lacus]
MRNAFFLKLMGLLLILSGCGGGDEISGDNNPNPDAPYFNSIGTQTALAGDQINFTISAIDPNGMNITLTYDGSYGPGDPFTAGASFNTSTGEFTWNTDSNDIGEYSVRLIATNDAMPPQETYIDVSIIVSSMAEYGEEVYNQHCARCHTPPLYCRSVQDINDALQFVGQMSGIQLSDEVLDVAAMAEYLGQVHPDPNYCNPL